MLYQSLFILLLYFWLLISSFSVSAKNTLDIVVGLAKPPYVLENHTEGFELELVKNILAKINFTPNYLFVPFGRSYKMFNTSNVDVLITTNNKIIKDVSLLSIPYITYQNVAVSLTERNLTINKVSDLSHYSIAAFQSAHRILGNKFANAAANSQVYTQVAKQIAQVELLFKNRVDVIVLDRNIFNFYRQKFINEWGNKAVTIHTVFPKTLYRAAFKNKALIPLFNNAYIAFSQTDDYQMLKKKYGLK